MCHTEFFIILVSNEFVHSAGISPLQSPAYSLDCPAKPVSEYSHAPPHSTSAPPTHSSIQTHCEGMSSTSPVFNAPPIVVPQVMSIRGEEQTLEEDDTAAVDRKDSRTDNPFMELTEYVVSSGESEDEREARREVSPLSLPHGLPLMSKSAPSIGISSSVVTEAVETEVHMVMVEEDEDYDEEEMPYIARRRSYTVSNTKDEEKKFYGPAASRSEAFTKSTTPPKLSTSALTTPTSSPPQKKRSHKKCHSLSGIDYDMEELQGDEQEEDRNDEVRPCSRTSSKTDTSDDSDEDSDDDSDDESNKMYNVTPGESNPLKPPNNSTIASSTLNTLATVAMSEEGRGTKSSDDATDSVSVPRMGRRFSNVITNVDDYHESSDDDSTTGVLHLSSGPGIHTAGGRDSRDDLSLSDIDISLNTSGNDDATPTAHIPSISSVFSSGLVRQDTTLSAGPSLSSPTTTTLTNGMVKSSIARHESMPTQSPSSRYKQTVTLDCHGRSSLTGQPITPRNTIRQLKNLMSLEARSNSPEYHGNFSDDSDQETNNRKQVTMFGTQRQTVSRTSSSASEGRAVGVVKRSHSGSSMEYEENSSSLDFVQPIGGQISPRQPHQVFDINPPSPLVKSKSPKDKAFKVSGVVDDIRSDSSTPKQSPTKLGSPLEKRVSKSVDDLLADNGERTDQGNKKNLQGAKSKEEGVRLIRFETLVEDEGKHKDIHTYYGIKEDKEPPKKGGFKLFRRESKKEREKDKKLTKRYDSSSSVEGISSTLHPSSSDEKVKDHATVSPSLSRTRRSATFHGDSTVEKSQSNISLTDEVSKSMTVDSSSSVTEKEESSSPILTSPTLTPSSPVSKLESQRSPDVEKGDTSMTISIEDHPDLSMEDDVSWSRTIDRRLRKSINKHEKGRQGAIFDWIRTERHIYRSLLVLKLVFRDKFASELCYTDSTLFTLFPHLDELLSISKNFSEELQHRQRASSIMVDDISDILLSQFTGEAGERMMKAYAGYCCRQSEALDLYRDLEKKKHRFVRLVNILYQNKLCERRKLPDFYLLVAQRISKYVELMKKLLKETETLKLDHLQRLRKSSMALQHIVESVDKCVDDYKNDQELNDIYNRLEIRHLKSLASQGVKNLDIKAHNRKLLKRGDGIWQGHGKQLSKPKLT